MIKSVERIIGHLHQDFWMGPHQVVAWSGYLPYPKCFVGRRVRIENVEGDPTDVEIFKIYGIVTFSVDNRLYYDAPVSGLLLEEWLRRAVEQISKSRGKALEQYLDSALTNGNLQLGGVDDSGFVIRPQQYFVIRVSLKNDEGSEFKARFKSPIKFRMVLDGKEERPVL